MRHSHNVSACDILCGSVNESVLRVAVDMYTYKLIDPGQFPK